jgi:hypothetical protein
MKNCVQEIEVLYGEHLRQWNGLLTEMPRVKDVINKNVTEK